METISYLFNNVLVGLMMVMGDGLYVITYEWKECNNGEWTTFNESIRLDTEYVDRAIARLAVLDGLFNAQPIIKSIVYDPFGRISVRY